MSILALYDHELCCTTGVFGSGLELNPPPGHVGVVAGVRTEEEPRERLLRALSEDEEDRDRPPFTVRSEKLIASESAIQGCCHIP